MNNSSPWAKSSKEQSLRKIAFVTFTVYPLDRGAGSDLLRGGLGTDQFVYARWPDVGDTIKDFKLGEDKIVLSELMDNLGYSGNNPIADGYLRLVQSSRGTSVQVDPDGYLGNGVFKALVTLENLSANTLNPTDFVF